MDVRFVTSDLRHFDDVRAEAIALPLFVGERPLRGAIGLVDWRLSGKLGRAVKDGRVVGRLGEHLLVPGRPKLPFEKLVVYGVGEREGFDDEAVTQALEGLFGTLSAARVRSTLCLLPGREGGELGPKRAMELFLEVVGGSEDHDEVTLIEGPEAQKEMTPVVERAKRRARAQRLE